MKKKLITLSSIGLVFAPLLAFAQGTVTQCGQIGGIQAIICKIGQILNTLIPIIIVLGVVYFVWGVVQYVIASDEEAKKTGRNRMIYGIIGLVVIVSMWGLVGIVRQTFGLDSAVVPPNITTPCVPGTLGCN